MRERRKLTRSDLATFLRLVGFAKPYWHRLLLGALCSAIGGGSIVALILSAQHILGFIFDSRSMLQGDEPHPAAVAAEDPGYRETGMPGNRETGPSSLPPIITS